MSVAELEAPTVDMSEVQKMEQRIERLIGIAAGRKGGLSFKIGQTFGCPASVPEGKIENTKPLMVKLLADGRLGFRVLMFGHMNTITTENAAGAKAFLSYLDQVERLAPKKENYGQPPASILFSVKC